jgi:hypothetical protein
MNFGPLPRLKKPVKLFLLALGFASLVLLLYQCSKPSGKEPIRLSPQQERRDNGRPRPLPNSEEDDCGCDVG